MEAKKAISRQKRVLQLSGSNASPTELKKASELSSFTDGKII